MQLVEALEAGIVTTPGDNRIHAVRMTLRGPVAMCGAGRVNRTLPGRFADADAHACYACLASVIPQQRRVG